MEATQLIPWIGASPNGSMGVIGNKVRGLVRVCGKESCIAVVSMMGEKLAVEA